MAYKVIKSFVDLQDNYHQYEIGEYYPRKEYKPTQARIKELSGGENMQGTPLIQKVTKTK